MFFSKSQSFFCCSLKKVQAESQRTAGYTSSDGICTALPGIVVCLRSRRKLADKSRGARSKAEAQVWSRNTWQDGPCRPDGPDGHAAVAAKSAAVVRLSGRRLLSDLSDKSDQSDKKACTTHKGLHVSTPKHSAFFEKRWGFGGRKRLFFP